MSYKTSTSGLFLSELQSGNVTTVIIEGPIDAAAAIDLRVDRHRATSVPRMRGHNCTARAHTGNNHSETAGKCLKISVGSRCTWTRSAQPTTQRAVRAFVLAKSALWIQPERSHASCDSMRRIEACDARIAFPKAGELLLLIY